MNAKLLNIALILSSLIGYLEWGEGNNMFLIQGEIDVILALVRNPLSVLHPFTLLPLIGQLLLVITLFQRQPGRILTFVGMACIGLLLILMFIIGLIGPNLKIVLSVLPFFVISILSIRCHRSLGNKQMV